MKNHRTFNLVAVACLVVGLFSLAGCDRGGSKVVVEEKVPAPLRVLNYADTPLGIRITRPDNPEGGISDSMGALTGGGRSSCCIAVPERWRPGLMVLVRYRTDAMLEGPWSEKLVELPRYIDDRTGDLYAVYYGPDDVQIWISTYGPGHERWPGRFPYPPGDKP